MQHYLITFADGSQISETKMRGTYEGLTDAQLRERDIVAIDRWSWAISDYVETRRVP